MDPNAAYATMTDTTQHPDDRADSARALVEWLYRGGHAPAGVSRHDAYNAAAAVLTECLADMEGIDADELHDDPRPAITARRLAARWLEAVDSTD